MEFKIIQKKAKSIIRWCAYFVLFVFTWGGMIRFSFNADTLAHIMAPDADVNIWLCSGRYIVALVDYVLWKFGYKLTMFIPMCVLAAFVFFSFTCLTNFKLFEKWVPTEIGKRICFEVGLILVVISPFFSELFMFAECTLMFSLAYLTASLAAYFYCKKKYVCFAILELLSVCIYQYAVIYTAILIVVYIALNNEFKWSIKAVIAEIVPVICCVFAGVLNMISYKILHKLGIIAFEQKTEGVGSIFDKIKLVIDNFILINKNVGGLLPSVWAPGIVLGLTIVGIICCVCYSTKTQKEKIHKFLYVFTVVIGCIVLLYSIPFISEKFYYPPRMAFVYFLVQGLVIIIYSSLEHKEKRDLLQKALPVICLGYVFIFVVIDHFIVIDRYKSNMLDKEYAKQVVAEIEKYEHLKNIEVTKIAIKTDAYSKAVYPGVTFAYEQINERTVNVVPTTAINALGGRNLQKVEMDEGIYNSYFADKDWDNIDLNEQMVFDGDTVYLCVY